MRIYELAKSIGQQLSIDVKSAHLAEEFKTLPQFAEIHDSIKSHASSVDDKYASLMFKIYKGRQSAKGTPSPAATLTPVAPSPQAPQAEKPTPRPTAVQPSARPLPPKLPPVINRKATPPRPKPISATSRPTPIPAVRRPAPIQPVGKVEAPAPVHPVAPAPAPQPAPAPAPQPAPAPAPRAAETKKPAVSPASAPQPAPRAAETKKPAGVRPVSPKAPRPAQRPTQKPAQRSAHAPGQAKKGPSKPTPRVIKPSANFSSLGQPKAPSMPKFSTDSPFIRPPRPPRPPAPPAPPRRPARKPGEEADRGARRPGGMDNRDRGRGNVNANANARGNTSARGNANARGNAKSFEPLAKINAVPEIGVMKLKQGHRRGGGGGDGENKGRVRPAAPSKRGVPAKGKKLVRPSRVYGGAAEFRRPLKQGKKRPPNQKGNRRVAPVKQKFTGPVTLTGPLTVSEFAGKMQTSPAEIIKSAFLKGKIITINQLIDFSLAEELAFEMDIDLIVAPDTDETDIQDYRIEDKEEDLTTRPPVVTIMGHVDHGKTTVLDYFRESQIVEGEFGGITQHIGAYQVKTDRGQIVFLDTPGHEAFTAMRARGAQCTDIAVLVVAADDGVMPQTLESINHARAAKVPIIVAINKIDLPQANPDRVRNELMQHGILPSQLGGDVEFVEISAKFGKNMDGLLEIIHLQSEFQELKGNPNRQSEGVIIESHIDSLRGAVATVLNQKGTLKVGDYIVVGTETGRVRAMLNDHGRNVTLATPSIPVEIIGLSGTPEVGELLLVMEDERKARDIAERRMNRRRLVELGTTRHVTLEGLHDLILEGKIKELNVILKADVQGSVEAVSQSLQKLSSPEIRVKILHSGTGSITESDVNLAMASSAIILGFNIRPEPSAADLAVHEQVEIKIYRIIYELLEEVEKAMVGMLDKKYKEEQMGRSEVRQVFRVSKVGTVAGSYVLSGEMKRNANCRLIRDSVTVYEGKISSLRRIKEDVSKVAQGFECGISLENFSDIKEGDIVEAFMMEEVPVELTRTKV